MGSDKFYPFVTEVSCYAKVNVFWIYVSVVSFIWGGGGGRTSSGIRVQFQ